MIETKQQQKQAVNIMKLDTFSQEIITLFYINVSIIFFYKKLKYFFNLYMII